NAGSDNDADSGADSSGGQQQPLRVVQATTTCPTSAQAPTQCSVIANQPSGCVWTPFLSSPWSWTPASSYDSSTNNVIASEAGTYQGDFEHSCTLSETGEQVSVTASCRVEVTGEPSVEDITDLFFVTGQANAAGIETAYSAELDAGDNRVFAYTDNGWQVADLRQNWESSLPGNFSNEDSSRQPYNHVGFQLTRAIAEDANRVVGLVVLTAPGEGISHWDYNSSFFVDMRNKATAALNELPHKSEFDAMIWMQGETDWLFEGTADPGATGFSDTDSDAFRNYYPTKLFQLISNFRSEFWFRFDGRFICAETKKAALNPHLMALNADNDPYTGCATASDLATRSSDPFGNHFSGVALRTIGERMADIYLSMDN
ncbi:MAG: sialate O-acetylesterase, partial [Pseudomonadota bacterium]